MGIISYSKAYRVNSKIVNAIEINEGYNGYAKDTTDKVLISYGYQRTKRNCPRKDGQSAIMEEDGQNGICIYYFDQGDTYSYGVLTYMTFDFPIVGKLFQIPVYTKTMTIKRLG